MAPAAAEAPDWKSFEREILCPLCDYDLRGLGEPRCPECGYRFEWGKLLDPATQLHPYLFEHHPRHNTWSFFKTFIAGFRPRRFWSTLKPTQPSRSKRLILYWILATGLLIATPAASFVRHVVESANKVRNERAGILAIIAAAPNDPTVRQAVARYASPQAYVDAIYPRVMSLQFLMTTYDSYQMYDWGQIHAVFAILGWPWMTFGVLMIFRQSMQRAKVRSIHVLRCVLYSCDWGLLAGLIVALFVTGNMLRPVVPFLHSNESIPMAAAVLFALYTAYRLGTAYQLYLQFDRPYATALAAQIIVVFVVFVLSVN